MARLYLTFGSVPELRPLSSHERIRVLQASSAAYAKTPTSWCNEWLRAALTLGLPIAAGLIAYLVFKDVSAACIALAVMALIGYRIWFQLYMTQLRPFIRETLQGPIPGDAVTAPARWRHKPWVAGLFFGGFMAGAILLTEDRLPWWALLLFAAGGGLFSGLFIGLAMRFLSKPTKGRWGSMEWIEW